MLFIFDHLKHLTRYGIITTRNGRPTDMLAGMMLFGVSFLGSALMRALVSRKDCDVEAVLKATEKAGNATIEESWRSGLVPAA
jgi:hypothetical protein